MAIRLSAANLDGLSARIATPSYAAADLQAGIVHFGIGNFHRAHQAVYLDMTVQSGARAGLGNDRRGRARSG